MKNREQFIDVDKGLKITHLGNVKTITGEDVIKQSIKTILSTIPGERLRYPEFGSNLYRLLFEGMDPEVAADIRDDITETLSMFENRIRINRVKVIPDYDNNMYDIEVTYFNVITKSNDVFDARVKAFEG